MILNDNKKHDYDELIKYFSTVGLYNSEIFSRIASKSRRFDIDNYLYNPTIGCYYDIDNDILKHIINQITNK